MVDRSQSLALIQKSGLVNTKMTLGEVLEIAGQLEKMDPGSVAEWTFISPHYIYKGDDLAKRFDQNVLTK